MSAGNSQGPKDPTKCVATRADKGQIKFVLLGRALGAGRDITASDTQ